MDDDDDVTTTTSASPRATKSPRVPARGNDGGGGGGGSVRASWRMTGDLNLPWRPRIDLTGQTTLGFMDAGVERGCLIVSYREEWGVSALDAVAQLVAPFKW
ncbi:uncharacterized protein MICPUCDRAFT_59348 [Micromonas pusilla CCMP1545]|uniref:Predicted protein n=1 Tax=Micromonas pusilla (strain CCMP1545) TaxID=564608 RepID=C1MVE5_MICPC|nr:uncharacterized protein MICPUCDRAFT_59348 [Micromonas pusilla CCMP1545]EEH55690.1 predicted protein [Micromonas pusilla CCMP1545]|eukprot:XP_003059738.1 predicted protein [Micromonas pusilla CCMP1545]